MSSQKSKLVAFAVLSVSLICAAQQKSNGRKLIDSDYGEIQRQIEQGQSNKAIESLLVALRGNSSDARLQNLLGIAYTSKHDLAKADAVFEGLLRKEPAYAPALRNLAINEEALGIHESAIRHLEKVLVLRPKDPVALAFLGSERFSHAQYAEAYALLSELSSASLNETLTLEREVSRVIGSKAELATEQVFSAPDVEEVSPKLLFSCAVMLAQNGHYVAAAKLFAALPEKVREQPDVVYNNALSLNRAGKNDEAIAVLKGYLDQHVHRADLLDLAADVYVAAGQIQNAIDALREATRLEPQVEDHYITLAEICTQYNAFDVGIEVIDVGLHFMPKSNRLYFEKGVLEAMTNNFEAADRDLGMADSLAPRQTMAGLAAGVKLMQEGNLAEAIATLSERAKKDPKNPVLQYMLAEALLQNGATIGTPELERAKEALLTATKNDPTYEPPLVSLAKLNVQNHQLEEAHQLLLRAVALSPKDSTAWSQLAIVDHRMGLKEEGVNAVSTLSALNQAQRNDRHQMQISIGSPN